MSAPVALPRPAAPLRRALRAMAWLLAGGVLVTALAALVLEWRVAAVPASASTSPPAPAETIARGAYLARAGHCAGCHTAPGGAAYAGGLAIATPFGTVVAGNLTPDAATGLGAWSADDFWRALHLGRGPGGRWLVPAFPYTSYTHVTREDSDALWAYLRSLPPVVRPNTPHALRFPYNTQLALALWQALYFEPQPQPQPQPKAPAASSADWQRGAYLVQGLGHCVACHGERHALGAVPADRQFAGGMLTQLGWYAPSLLNPAEASVADWPIDQVVQLLRTGTAPHASTLGPMAEVVLGSTQHLHEADLRAMATYLRALPGAPAAAAPVPLRAAKPAEPAPAEVRALGERLYRQQCAACHGAQGEGAPGAYPPLAGNRAVTMGSVTNPIRVLLQGGFTPATAGHPRPYGMPPALLDDTEMAAVLTHVRQSWGHQASAVTPLQVRRVREGAGE